jgi:plastocyanin domain-containing protein
MRSWTLALAALLLTLPFAGLAEGHDHDAMRKQEAAAKASPKVVDMTISDDGISPMQIAAVKGEPLRINITRKTNGTCITQLVVQDYGIKQDLPLGKTVAVDITPKTSGKVRLACGMGMTFATLVVQ